MRKVVLEAPTPEKTPSWCRFRSATSMPNFPTLMYRFTMLHRREFPVHALEKNLNMAKELLNDAEAKGNHAAKVLPNGPIWDLRKIFTRARVAGSSHLATGLLFVRK